MKLNRINHYTPLDTIRAFPSRGKCTALSLKIRLFIYQVLAGICFVFKCRKMHYYRAMAAVYQCRINTVAFKAIFKQHQVFGAVNVAENSVLKDSRSALSARLLYAKVCKKLNKYTDIQSFPMRISNGICMGIAIDLAYHYVVNGRSLHFIVEMAKRGGTQDAEANQAVIFALSLKRSGVPVEKMIDLFKEMSLTKSGYTELNVDFDAIWERYIFMKKNPLLQDKTTLIQTINQKFSNLSKKFPDLHCFFLESRSKKINEAKWVLAFLEFDELLAALPPNATADEFPNPSIAGKKLSDPVLNELILSLYLRHFVWNVNTEIVAEMRKLKMISMDSKLGSSRLFPNDESYLAKLASLNPGFYGISFSANNYNHILVYIKQKNSSGLIIDPNGMQIFSPTAAAAKKIILEMLRQFYPCPANSQELVKDAFHNLRINKFEKLSQ